jgi:hypothetical protein
VNKAANAAITPQTGYQAGATRHRGDTALRHFGTSCEPTSAELELASAECVEKLIEWGLTAWTRRAEHAVIALASWLAHSDHTFGRIHVELRYDPLARELRIRAKDRGSMLPVFESAEVLRTALTDARDATNGAEYLAGGRMVWCVLKPEMPWTVRYAWHLPDGMIHPRHTTERHESKEQAIQAANWALRNRDRVGNGLAIEAVAIRGPGDEGWRQCQDSDEAVGA